MKERPIIMTAESVRAILAGRKTQTRMVIKPQPPSGWFRDEDELNEPGHREWCAARCPHGVVGDRLWVREAWSHDADDIAACRAAHEDALGGIVYGPYYRATEVAPDTLRWISPVLMPRWASRITLEVTQVRVQRLHAITEEDADAEGVLDLDGRLDNAAICHAAKVIRTCPEDSRAWYGAAWDAINGARRVRVPIPFGRPGYGGGGMTTTIDTSVRWEMNPWVWAVTFTRVEAER